MLHYIHHPSGPIVLLTTSPYILLSHQATGWLTTPSFADVLAEHPEWREAEENGERRRRRRSRNGRDVWKVVELPKCFGAEDG
jgi:hypothetical protein